MTRNLRTLIIDDDAMIRESLHKLLNNKVVEKHYTLITKPVDFPEALVLLETENFELITLDLCQGAPVPDADKIGIDVLKKIQGLTFIPVVFYTGLPSYVVDLTSPVVKVVNKNDGVDTLKEVIATLIRSRLVDLKEKLCGFIETELKQYFWDTIHENRKQFNSVEHETSLCYLITRRISQALSKEKIKELLADDKIELEKVHPMEFYIYPTISEEFETGEILRKQNKYFVILTPSCDFVENASINRKRKVGMVLLAETISLEETPEYIAYLASKTTDNKKKLAKVMSSGKSDRYYFLPGTPFMKAQVVDFQNKKVVDYSDLKDYERIKLIDSPYSQSMISSFIRHYNRIGTPDLDTEFIITSIG